MKIFLGVCAVFAIDLNQAEMPDLGMGGLTIEAVNEWNPFAAMGITMPPMNSPRIAARQQPASINYSSPTTPTSVTVTPQPSTVTSVAQPAAAEQPSTSPTSAVAASSKSIITPQAQNEVIAPSSKTAQTNSGSSIKAADTEKQMPPTVIESPQVTNIIESNPSSSISDATNMTAGASNYCPIINPCANPCKPICPVLNPCTPDECHYGQQDMIVINQKIFEFPKCHCHCSDSDSRSCDVGAKLCDDLESFTIQQPAVTFPQTYMTPNLQIQIPASLRYVIQTLQPTCIYNVTFRDSILGNDTLLYIGQADNLETAYVVDLQIGTHATDSIEWFAYKEQDRCTNKVEQHRDYTRPPVYDLYSYWYPTPINGNPSVYLEKGELIFAVLDQIPAQQCTINFSLLQLMDPICVHDKC